MRLKNIKIDVLIGLVVGVAVIVAVVVVFRIRKLEQPGSGLNEEFNYDVKGFQKTRRELVQYQEEAKIGSGLGEVRGLAVGPKDQVFVAGDQVVRVLSIEGSQLTDVKLSEPARCLAVAEDGAIYVGMKDHVEVYNHEGKKMAGWKTLGANAQVTSVAVAKSDVFVGDAGNRIVLHYNTSGKLLNRIGEKDPHKNAPGLLLPSPYLDVAVGRDGLLRVQDPGRHRVETYTFDGILKSFWGKASMTIEGFSGCCNPTHFAMFPDGRYVTTEKGLPRVKIHDRDGNFSAVVAGTEIFTDHTRGLDVSVDSRSRVLVLDPVQKAVRVFSHK